MWAGRVGGKGIKTPHSRGGNRLDVQGIREKSPRGHQGFKSEVVTRKSTVEWE